MVLRICKDGFTCFRSSVRSNNTYLACVRNKQLWRLLHCGENSTARSEPTATFWVSGAPLTPHPSPLADEMITYGPNKHTLGVHRLYTCPWPPHCVTLSIEFFIIRCQRRYGSLRAPLITLTLLMCFIGPIASAEMLRVSPFPWKYPKRTFARPSQDRFFAES